jgi:large subunit ribosomal protein L19
VLTRGQVRRAKLYYLRNLSGKAARITSEKSPRGTVAETETKSAEAKE